MSWVNSPKNKRSITESIPVTFSAEGTSFTNMNTEYYFQ
jgi:hypothetical protein